MVGIEVYRGESLRKIFPLSMEVYFCDFGFDIIILRPVTKKYICKCLAKVSIYNCTPLRTHETFSTSGR